MHYNSNKVNHKSKIRSFERNVRETEEAMKYNRGNHSVYLLTYHLVFVIKYRKPLIDEEMGTAMKEFARHMTEDRFDGKLISAETDLDHIHLLVSLPPQVDISTFVRSTKTQISREMRKRFPEKIGKYLHGKDVPFWTFSYFAATTGSVSLETVKQYIENQPTEEHQAKRKARNTPG